MQVDDGAPLPLTNNEEVLSRLQVILQPNSHYSRLYSPLDQKQAPWLEKFPQSATRVNQLPLDNEQVKERLLELLRKPFLDFDSAIALTAFAFWSPEELLDKRVHPDGHISSSDGDEPVENWNVYLQFWKFLLGDAFNNSEFQTSLKEISKAVVEVLQGPSPTKKRRSSRSTPVKTEDQSSGESEGDDEDYSYYYNTEQKGVQRRSPRLSRSIQSTARSGNPSLEYIRDVRKALAQFNPPPPEMGKIIRSFDLRDEGLPLAQQLTQGIQLTFVAAVGSEYYWTHLRRLAAVPRIKFDMVKAIWRTVLNDCAISTKVGYLSSAEAKNLLDSATKALQDDRQLRENLHEKMLQLQGDEM